MTAILTDITQQYAAASESWHTYLFPVAQHLFGLLATIEIAWSGILWSLNKSEVESLWIEFLKKMVTIGFAYTILIEAPIWIPDVIQSFIKVGAGASKVSGLYPSDILDQGISIASSVMQPLLKAGLLHAGIGLIVGAAASIIVVISFAWIAAELTVSLIESYMVVSSGLIMLSFAANRFTSSYSSKYLGYAISVGVKLFMLYLIIGVGGHLATHWGQRVIEGGIKNMTPYFEIIGGALVFLYIARTIPQKAESLLSGTVGSSGSGLGAIAMGAAMMASRGAVNAVQGGAEAVKQAAMVSSHHGHTAGGMIKGIATAGVNLAASALGSHSGHYRNVGSGMSQRSNALDRKHAGQRENKASNTKKPNS